MSKKSVDDVWAEMNAADPAAARKRGTSAVTLRAPASARGVRSKGKAAAKGKGAKGKAFGKNKRKGAAQSRVQLPRGMVAAGGSGGTGGASSAVVGEAAPGASATAAAATAPATSDGGLRLPSDDHPDAEAIASLAGSGEAFSVDAFLTLVRRDLNGASDEAPATRKRALERLFSSLFYVPGRLSDDQLAAIFPEVMKPVLKRFDDSVERCRELAVSMIQRFLAVITDVAPALPYVVPVMIERIVPADLGYDHDMNIFVKSLEKHEEHRRGRVLDRDDVYHDPYATKVVDPSEEVRLYLCNAVYTLCETVSRNGAHAVLNPYLLDIFLAAEACAVDPYPELRIRGCQLIVALTQMSPEGTKVFAVGMVRAIMPGLDHRHAKVRIAVLDAIAALVTCEDKAKCKGCATEAIFDLVGHHDENTIPVAAFYRHETNVNYFAKLVIDRSPQVRERFVRHLGHWSISLPDRIDYQPRLLPYLLNGVADEAPPVHKAALEYLEALGIQYEKEHHDELIEKKQYAVDGDSRVDHESPYPEPFGSRPRIGTRVYVRSHCRRFIKAILKELGIWQHETRVHAARMLFHVQVFMEEHITVDLHDLVQTLYHCIDDREIGGIIETCASMTGRFTHPDAYLPLILPYVRGDELVKTFGDNEARCSVLSVFTLMMEASKPGSLLPHLHDIVVALSDDFLVSTRLPELRIRHLRAISALCRLLDGRAGSAAGAAFGKTGRLGDVKRDTTQLLSLLLRMRGDESLRVEVDSALESLARAAELPSVSALVADRFHDVLMPVLTSYPATSAWRSDCPEHTTVVHLVELGTPQAVAAYQETLCDLAFTLMNEEDLEAAAVEAKVAAADLLIASWASSEAAFAARSCAPGILASVVAADGWDGSQRGRSSWLALVEALLIRREAPSEPVKRVVPAASGATESKEVETSTRGITSAVGEPSTFTIASPTDIAAALDVIVDTLLAWDADASQPADFRGFIMDVVRVLLEAGGATACSPRLEQLYATVCARLDDSSEEVRLRAAQALPAVLRASPFAPPERGVRHVGTRAKPSHGSFALDDVASSGLTLERMISDALRAQHAEGTSEALNLALSSFTFEATVSDPAAVAALVRSGRWQAAAGGTAAEAIEGSDGDADLSEQAAELLDHAEVLLSLMGRDSSRT